MFLQYTFARAFRCLYIAMLPTNKKNQALRDVNYNNKDSKGMFNEKKKNNEQSAVFWFEFYSKSLGPRPFISGVTSEKDMPLKTNPSS